MKVETFKNGVLGVNTYFLIGDNGDAVCIDCGEKYERTLKAAEGLGVKIKAILLTHAHFDHSAAGKRFQEDGVPVYISEKDNAKLSNDGNLAALFERPFYPYSADFTFKDGDELDLCGYKIKVIETAGHTDGSVTFITGNVMFSGDTLFYMSYGNTGFVSGSLADMKKSLNKLFSLTENYVVLPGHGQKTSLFFERENNPINYD